MKNNQRLITGLSIAALAVIFAFIFVVFFSVFQIIFSPSNITPLGDFISAFAGAFFAFIFLRIGDALTRIYDRKIKNRNSLAKVELIGNRYMNEVNDVDFVMDDMIKTATETITTKSVNINYNELEKIEILHDLTDGLTNIDFLNQVFVLNVHLQKFNGSIRSAQKFYDDLNANYINKNIDLNTYLYNMEIFKEKMVHLRKFVQTLLDELVDVVATSKYLISLTNTLLNSFVSLFSKAKIDDKDKEGVNEQKSKLLNEIEQNRKASQDRINKTLEQ